MKIGIDARPLIGQSYTGIPFYTYMILSEWMEKHPEHEYYLFSFRPICWSVKELPENWHIVNEPWVINKGTLWYLFKVPELIQELQLDAYWGPNFSLPRKVRGTSYYVTIHDLGIYHFKHVGQRRNEIHIKSCLPGNIKKSEKVIAISEYTKQDIIDIFGTCENKITTIYNGGVVNNAPSAERQSGGLTSSSVLSDDKGESSTSNKEASVIRPEISNLGTFFLFIGTIEPRKNIPTIVAGYERYISAHKSNCNENPPTLVIAGGRGWNCDSIYERIEKSPYRDHIYLPGYISGEEKTYLLDCAKILLYPSLLEGFGIPVLEAYAHGTPAITANNSSLPEVGGDAAYYIETYDDAALADAIYKVMSLSEDELESLRGKMRAQLSKFSWEKCAEETLAVLMGS